jgi:hypothetical protein
VIGPTDADRGAPPLTSRVFVPRTAPDERPARHALLQQIARFEAELADLFCSTWPRKDMLPALGPQGRGGPRLLDFAQLEALRDELHRSVDEARRALSARTRIEEQNRRRIEEMLLEPERHRWARVQNEDIGEPGCKSWHVRPRFGVLGMLLNWWRVRISSGCPLAT